MDMIYVSPKSNLQIMHYFNDRPFFTNYFLESREILELLRIHKIFSLYHNESIQIDYYLSPSSSNLSKSVSVALHVNTLVFGLADPGWFSQSFTLLFILINGLFGSVNSDVL